ncbi:MAG: [FeFe] hydrogenase H-cluster maturation GTPase HydF [Lachnospiraceae bacterium]|nr:[FeFe] hydrogenase H-cluster maturation GTPase HydF [Lachnospiraceae bacterium]
MSLNDTPSGERLHISFFGCINSGKSSLINAFTGQEVSIVDEKEGTTTDPVSKAMELLPLGPVVIADTPGIDDRGELGEKRIKRSLEILRRTDLAVLVIDSKRGIRQGDRELIGLFSEKKIPCLLAYNKADLLSIKEREELLNREDELKELKDIKKVAVSALKGWDIDALKESCITLAGSREREKSIIGDLISKNDRIVLVCPIDASAPKGRLILPQQQVIRDALDNGAIPLICREWELEKALSSLKEPPAMVITDSQAFEMVASIVPKEVPLSSFSILMARYKGNLKASLEGAEKLDEIKEGDTILISEGCSHHRQCGDIGSVKLPAMIERYRGIKPKIELSSGKDFPLDKKDYSLIIHCGACMLNEAEARGRYREAREKNIPITNYGIAIAYMKGIFKRSVKLFPELYPENQLK